MLQKVRIYVRSNYKSKSKNFNIQVQNEIWWAEIFGGMHKVGRYKAYIYIYMLYIIIIIAEERIGSWECKQRNGEEDERSRKGEKGGGGDGDGGDGGDESGEKCGGARGEEEERCRKEHDSNERRWSQQDNCAK